MAVNKVTLGDETLIDLTNDTAEAEDVLEGAYFHTAAGVRTAGTRRNIVVDDELSPTSENPVQNKVIYEALQNIHIDVDDELSVTSENPVQNKVVTLALDQKADAYGRTESGDIVSFYASEHANKNLLGLTVDIQPNQDLHGYDSPWPAGGGKNKLPNIPLNTTEDNFSIVGENGVYTVNATVTAYSKGTTTLTEFTLPAGTYTLSAVKSAQETLVYVVLYASDGIMQIASVNSQPSTFTLSEATAIRLGINVMRGTVSNLTVRPMIEVGSTATEYAPVENLCPITGWSAVGITSIGNMADGATYEPGYYGNDGTPTESGTTKRTPDYFPVIVGQTYRYYYNTAASQRLRVHAYDANKTWLQQLVNTTDHAGTFTIPSNAAYIRWSLPNDSTDIRIGLGNTYAIALGQTVYGGVLDAVNGVLTVDRAAVDLGTVSWTYYTTVTPPVFYGDLPNGKGVADGEATALSICSCYPLASQTAVSANVFSANAPDMSFGQNGRAASCRMFIKDSRYSSASDLATALSGQKVVYELATPIEIQLDPVQIAVIRAKTNNIWADAGTVDVTYAADIEAETQSKLNRKAGMLVDSVSGAIASFVPDATIPDLLGVSVAVEPVQAGSGDPSPDNVRPISGWSEVGIEAAGKNLIDSSNATSGLCGYRAGDTLYTVVASTRYSHSVQIPARGGLKLSYRSNDVSTFNQCLIECFVGRNWVSAITGNAVSDTSTVIVLTVPANTYDWVKVMYSAPTGGVVGTNINGDIQLETGSSATDFLPFAGNTYTIAIGQTVYGGMLDVTNGTMTVDRVFFEKTFGALSATSQSAPAGYVVKSSGLLSQPGDPIRQSELLCNVAKQNLSSIANSFRMTATGNYMYFCLPEDTDSSLAVTAVYPIATPITIQLDPVTISTIAGQTNNVWADAGDVSVEYAADIKAYIDSKISALIAQIVNS